MIPIPMWPGTAAARLLATLLAMAVGAAPALFAASPEAEGLELAAQMRAQRPATNLTTSGTLRLRDSHGKWRQSVPVSMEIVVGEDAWETTYQAFDSNQVVEVLVVSHRFEQPNQYLYAKAEADGSGLGPFKPLNGRDLYTPFAGSEYWLGDLGLDFFHWPQQRLVNREMRKGRSCRVLESVNPLPPPGGYARVLSWIDFETSGLLRAEAYGQDGKLLKEFSVGGFKKINRVWQLKSMDIRNDRTDCRTRLEFDLELEE